LLWGAIQDLDWDTIIDDICKTNSTNTSKNSTSTTAVKTQHKYISSNIKTLYYQSFKRLDNSNPNSIYYVKFLEELRHLLNTDAFNYTNAVESIFFKKFSNIYKDFENNAIVNDRYSHNLETLRTTVYNIFTEEYSTAIQKVRIILKENRSKKGYILYHINKANEVAFGLASNEVHTTLEKLIKSISSVNLNEELEAIAIKEGVLNCVVHFLDTQKFSSL
jgi:hypothetical protein